MIMKFTLLICLALLFATCSGDDDRPNTCSVLFPVTQLDWLKEAIESYEDGPADITVEQGTYQSETVFIINPCCPVCSSSDMMNPPPVYTCEGDTIENLYPSDAAIKDQKVIWKTPAEEAECW